MFLTQLVVIVKELLIGARVVDFTAGIEQAILRANAPLKFQVASHLRQDHVTVDSVAASLEVIHLLVTFALFLLAPLHESDGLQLLASLEMVQVA